MEHSSDSGEIKSNELPIGDEVLAEWQNIINLLAEIMEVPAALIMRVHPPVIEVFVANESEDNPYKVGGQEHLPGLYCNWVMSNDTRLLVPNALKDPEWEDNPDVKLNMISYIGLPLKWPNGDMFGTICALDNQENYYNDNYVKLLDSFKNIVSKYLELVWKNYELERARDKIRELKEFLVICAACKKIKIQEDKWIPLVSFYKDKDGTKFSHGLCPVCLEKYNDLSAED